MNKKLFSVLTLAIALAGGFWFSHNPGWLLAYKVYPQPYARVAGVEIAATASVPCEDCIVSPPITKYSLTVSKTGTGSGVVFEGAFLEPGSVINCGTICRASFLSGVSQPQSITLTAKVDTGSAFTGWSGDCSGTDKTCVLSITNTKQVTAIFDVSTDTSLRTGDIVKLSDQPTIFYISEGRRYPFPYVSDWTDWKKVYYSWGLVDNEIKIVTPEQLSQLPLGPYITVRPGTYLIQSMIDSGPANVYAVTYNHILCHVTPESLPILYGTNWQSRLLRMPQDFMVNYDIGPDVGTLPPDGTQISLSTMPYGQYLIYEGKKKLLSQDTWVAQRYGNYSVNLPTVGQYLSGTNLVGSIPCLSDVTQMMSCDFSGLGVMDIHGVSSTAGTATVTWQTNLPANGFVQYGTDMNQTIEISETSSAITNHSITLTGLQTGVWYYYRVSAVAPGSVTRVYSDWSYFTTNVSNDNPSLISPVGGEQWQIGKTYTIGWNTSTIPAEYRSLRPEFEFIDEQGRVAYRASAVSGTFVDASDTRFGNTYARADNINLRDGQRYRVQIVGWTSDNVKVIGGISDGYITAVNSITSRPCSGTSSVVSRSALRTTEFDNLGLDISSHPEILKYRIQWFSGAWSDWFTPGVDDVDWKTNNDGTRRRVWGYFGDHAHEFQKCSATTTNSAPVIKELTGTRTLSVNQMGSWIIRASDADSTSLLYEVNFGEPGIYPGPIASYDQTAAPNVDVVFKHSYSAPGNYTIWFWVFDKTNPAVSKTYPVQVAVVGSTIDNSQSNVTTTPDQSNLVLQERIKKLDYQVSDIEQQVVAAEKKLTQQVDVKLTNRVAGKILLQVEGNGEAWYVDKDTQKKFYLKDGNTAYTALRAFGLGITNNDLAKIPVGLAQSTNQVDTDNDGLVDNLENAIGTNPDNKDSDSDGYLDAEELLNGYSPLGVGKVATDGTLTNRLNGKIMLQVESHGEAWYVLDGKRYYLANGDSAYQIMRSKSLGITNDDLRKISVGEFE